MKNILPAMLRHHDFTVNSKCKNIVSKYSDAKSGTGLGKVVCHPGSNWGP